TNNATASYCVSEAASGSRAGSGRRSGGTLTSCSPVRRSGTRLVARSFTFAVAPSSAPTDGAASSTCSKLSSTSSRRRSAIRRAEGVGAGLGAGVGDPERLRDRRQQECRVRQRGEGDEEYALREELEQLRARLEREPGLAHAAGPGQREQSQIVADEQSGDRA